MKFTIFFIDSTPTLRPILTIEGVGKPHYNGELIWFNLLNGDGTEGETKWWFSTRTIVSIERTK